MRNILILALFIGIVQAISAQAPGILSVNRFGGSEDDYVNKVVILNNGNYLYSGFTGSSDYDAVGNHGKSDFFLICQSSRGKVLWKKLIGGTDEDGFNYEGDKVSVSVTADGFYLSGSTRSSDGDIPGNKGGVDVFVARYDEDGNVLWKNVYGGAGDDYSSALVTTTDGGCVFAGIANSDSSGDVPESHGLADIWITKLDSLGHVVWTRLYGGTSNEIASDLKNTPDGGYVFTGKVYSSDGDFAGNEIAGMKVPDAWLVKLDSTGDITWTFRIGGQGEESHPEVLVSSAGDYYVVGNTYSNNTGNIPATNGHYDIFLCKLNTDGRPVFIKTFGTNGADWHGGVIEAADGHILMAGFFGGYNLNGIPTGLVDGSDGMLSKIDKNSGDLIWLNTFKGSGNDLPKSLIKSSSGEIVIAGITSSGDHDFTNPMGGFDIFVIKQAAFNIIKGTVFYDYDGDGIQSASEPLVPNLKVTSTKSGVSSAGGYADSGRYLNEVDSGTFVTRPRLFNSDYYKVMPDSFVNSFPGYYGSVSQNFGIQPIKGKRDLQTTLWAVTAARAGFLSQYQLVCYNAGTETIESAVVKMVMDKRSAFSSAYPAPGNILGDTIVWAIADLKPLDTLIFNVTLDLVRPPGLTLNSWLRFVSIADSVKGELTPSDNTFVLLHLVTGSYDPNDKMEAHGDFYTTERLANKDYLYYRIRFQNTGTDTAFNIEIKDTLDGKLDVNSIDLLNTSHPGTFTISNNICSWKFANILLPDSNRNEQASHGFITYRIRPNDYLHVNDTVKNAASIYFDYNDPVVTNTCFTVVKLPTVITPVISAITDNLCSNSPVQKIRILNLPDKADSVQVTAALDGQEVAIATDSTCLIQPGSLREGKHTFTISYRKQDESTTTSSQFIVFATIIPAVVLKASADIVQDTLLPLVLTASVDTGSGKASLFLFARDRGFESVLQPESIFNTTSIPVGFLALGRNVLYVQLTTDAFCYTRHTAVDSVVVFRNPMLPVPPIPVISGLKPVYCQNLPGQAVYLSNIPADSIQASVLASLDGNVVELSADGSIVLDILSLTPGTHTLQISYSNSAGKQTVDATFAIVEAVTPVVSLAAPVAMFNNIRDTIRLIASPVSGGGLAPMYTFKKNNLSELPLQPSGTGNILSITASALSPGNNLFYVQMQTSSSCYTQLTAVDSVVVLFNETESIWLRASPNPFANTVKVNGLVATQRYHFYLYSADGSLLQYSLNKGADLFVINKPLPPGIVYLVIYNGQQQRIGTLTLLKK